MFVARLLIRLVTWNSISWSIQEYKIMCVMFATKLLLLIVLWQHKKVMCAMFAARPLLRLVSWNDTSWFMQKKIVCDVCNKVFAWAGNLKQHKLIHTRHKSNSTQESVSPSPQWHQLMSVYLSWETSLYNLTVFVFLENCFAYVEHFVTVYVYQIIQLLYTCMYQFGAFNSFTASRHPGLSWQMWACKLAT
jgi:hypothetical protein